MPRQALGRTRTSVFFFASSAPFSSSAMFCLSSGVSSLGPPSPLQPTKRSAKPNKGAARTAEIEVRRIRRSSTMTPFEVRASWIGGQIQALLILRSRLSLTRKTRFEIPSNGERSIPELRTLISQNRPSSSSHQVFSGQALLLQAIGTRAHPKLLERAKAENTKRIEAKGSLEKEPTCRELDRRKSDNFKLMTPIGFGSVSQFWSEGTLSKSYGTCP